MYELSPAFQKAVHPSRHALVAAFIDALNQTDEGQELVLKAETLAERGLPFNRVDLIRALDGHHYDTGEYGGRSVYPRTRDGQEWEDADIALLFGFDEFEGGSSLEEFKRNEELTNLPKPPMPSDPLKLYHQVKFSLKSDLKEKYLPKEPALQTRHSLSG